MERRRKSLAQIFLYVDMIRARGIILSEQMKRKLLVSLVGIIVLIPIGRYSRQVSWLPDEVGDALWAMMVFCFWRIILVKKGLPFVALISLIHSYLVEFSQLIRWPWLMSFRGTFIGHMMFGQGFLWIDLLAYLIGISLIYWVFHAIEQRWG